MKILIIGATGQTGRCVIQSALDAGHEVTAFARHTESLNELDDQIEIITGDAISTPELEKAMTGKDAVISTLGRGKSTRAHNLFTRAAVSIVNAANHTEVKRLIWMSSFGVGETFKDANVAQKVAYSTMLRNIYTNKADAERIIRLSHLNWTIVYPSALTNGNLTGEYQIGEHLRMSGAPRISRADVADCMINLLKDDEWIHRGIEITN
ncbi:NAD(P)-dependent oxidoreductase [Companilactobacillus hulinensis]|uniref:NAD(P)-dependent oxidoreductase n=1 Tax=Companilactobacillus hulinensis TaxID=2486007 RepID=UPI000F7992C9|nr:SDR family oxidoreductase [Companilactobacillus hulinensis]